MPDIAADAKAIAFGNFKRGYTIVDRIGTRILRDPYTKTIRWFLHHQTYRRNACRFSGHQTAADRCWRII